MKRNTKSKKSFIIFILVECGIFVILSLTLSNSSQSIISPNPIRALPRLGTPTRTDGHYPDSTSTSTLLSGITGTVLSLTPTNAPPVVTITSAPSLENQPQGKIVFTCTPENFNQLCIVDANGDHYTRITNRRANDYYPSFSPDGVRIVFASNKTGQFEVRTIGADGSAEEQLTQNSGNVTAPEISPDGNWIVYASKQAGDSSIWLMENLGDAPFPVTDAQWNEIDPTWSPDGQKIAFSSVRGGYVELFVMDRDGSNIRQVTHDIPRIGGRSSWSPDGKKLVFYAGSQKDRDIYVVEIETGLSTRLTFGGNNTGPCFSPDGNWIVFSSSRDGDHDLYIMRTDGSGLRQLTFNSYDDWQPRWGR